MISSSVLTSSCVSGLNIFATSLLLIKTFEWKHEGIYVGPMCLCWPVKTLLSSSSILARYRPADSSVSSSSSIVWRVKNRLRFEAWTSPIVYMVLVSRQEWGNSRRESRLFIWKKHVMSQWLCYGPPKWRRWTVIGLYCPMMLNFGLARHMIYTIITISKPSFL